MRLKLHYNIYIYIILLIIILTKFLECLSKTILTFLFLKETYLEIYFLLNV